MKKTLRFLCAAALVLAGGQAEAQDFSLSGFGTLGWAQSNRDYTYQRSIDRGGSFAHDSVLGLQVDAGFTPQWSATLQLKLAQSLEKDDRWDLRPAWAFVGWRPSDDWLLRAGRMRVPLYLYSESLDVGVGHDFARLPAEMYSIVPSSDFDGGAVARTWSLGSGELALDGYAGRIGTAVRFWYRDGLPPEQPAGAHFERGTVDTRGLVLTWRTADSTWRAGLHRTRTSRSGGQALALQFPFVEVMPGIGYYQVDPRLPGPGIETAGAVRNTVLAAGFDQALGEGWRVTGEYARVRQLDSEMGSASDGGYLALSRSIGRVTPYLSVARLRSTDSVLDWYRKLTTTQLPSFVPNAAMINAAMRVAGESGYATDQSSLALGASWAFDARQKLKLEWCRTRIGLVSRAVDTPPGSETPHDTHLDVWSVNYSFSF